MIFIFSFISIFIFVLIFFFVYLTVCLGIYLILLHKVAHLLSFWTCGKLVINTMVTLTPWPVPLKRLGGHTRNSRTLQNLSSMKPTLTTAGKMDSSPLPLKRQSDGQLRDIYFKWKKQAAFCPMAFWKFSLHSQSVRIPVWKTEFYIGKIC